MVNYIHSEIPLVTDNTVRKHYEVDGALEELFSRVGRISLL